MKDSFVFLTAVLVALGGIIAFMYFVGKNGIKLSEFKPCEFLRSLCQKCKKDEDTDIED